MFQCPTCYDAFVDPVILPCGHSFCAACLQNWRDTWANSLDSSGKTMTPCPQCKREFPRSMRAPPNYQLRDAMNAGMGIVPKAVQRQPKQYPGVGKFPPTLAPGTVNIPPGDGKMIPHGDVRPPRQPKTSPHTMYPSPAQRGYDLRQEDKKRFEKRRNAADWDDAAKRARVASPQTTGPGHFPKEGTGTGGLKRERGWLETTLLLQRGLVPPRSTSTPTRPPTKKIKMDSNTSNDLGACYRICFIFASSLRDGKRG